MNETRHFTMNIGRVHPHPDPVHETIAKLLLTVDARIDQLETALRVARTELKRERAHRARILEREGSR